MEENNKKQKLSRVDRMPRGLTPLNDFAYDPNDLTSTDGIVFRREDIPSDVLDKTQNLSSNDIFQDGNKTFTLKRVVKDDKTEKDGLGEFCKSTVQGSIQAIAVKVVTGALVVVLCGLGINLGTSSNSTSNQPTINKSNGSTQSSENTNNNSKNNSSNKKANNSSEPNLNNSSDKETIVSNKDKEATYNSQNGNDSNSTNTQTNTQNSQTANNNSTENNSSTNSNKNTSQDTQKDSQNSQNTETDASSQTNNNTTSDSSSQTNQSNSSSNSSDNAE